jgi:hypothetical protein
LARVGPVGMLGLYVYSIAYKTKKEFKLRDLCPNLQLLQYQYAVGTLVVMHGTGLFDGTQSNDLWRISDLNAKLRDIQRSIIEGKIFSAIRANNVDDSVYKARIINDLDEIEKYFG